MTYPLEKYTERQRENWAQSKRITIYENEAQLREFIRDARKNKISNKKMYFGTIPEKLAERIKKDTGAEVKGYNVSISESEIRKIFKKHGNEAVEAPRGQRAITETDIASIPEIIQNPDKIMLDGRLYIGKPIIKFAKTIDGRTTVVSYISDKHSDLAVQTMYSGINKGGTLASPTDVHAPALTSKTRSGTGSATHNIQNSKEDKMSGKSYRTRFVDAMIGELKEKNLKPRLLPRKPSDPIFIGLANSNGYQMYIRDAGNCLLGVNLIIGGDSGKEILVNGKRFKAEAKRVAGDVKWFLNRRGVGLGGKAKPVKGLPGYPTANLEVFKPDPKNRGKNIYQNVLGGVVLTSYGEGRWRVQVMNDADNFASVNKITNWGDFTNVELRIEGFPPGVGYELKVTNETYDRIFLATQIGRSVRVDAVYDWVMPKDAKPDAPKTEAKQRNSEIKQKISERFPGASDRVIVASPNLNAEKASSKEAGFAKAARIPKSSGDLYRKIVFVSQAMANEKHTSRPALAFLKVEKSDGATDIVATTSHILNHARFEAGEAPAIDALEPGLYRIAKGKDDAALMQADCDAVYPDWRMVIPKESELDAVAGSFSFGSKDEVNFAKSIYKLARAGYCANVNYLKLLEGFSWGAKLNKEKTLAVFESAKGDCKSLVMAIKTEETEAMNGLFSDRRQSCR